MNATLERPQTLDERGMMEAHLRNLNECHKAYMYAQASGNANEVFRLRLAYDAYLRWFMAHEILLGCDSQGYTIWQEAM